MKIYTIKPELLGTTTPLMLQPNMISGSRGQMQGAHYPQAPQIVGCELRTLFTGSEEEYGKWMFNIIVEDDCYVDRVFERRAKSSLGNFDVLETHIYVKLADESRTFDVIVVPRYESNHQYFGYDYVPTKHMSRLTPGKLLRKGTVLAECPTIIDKEWCIGMQANTILVSQPQVIEDACIINDRLGDGMLAYGYKTFRMFYGEKEYPLYLYGTDDEPRIHPNVGEQVRDDGILFGKRTYDDILCGIEMSTRSLREPCGHGDIITHTDKEAVVHDIRVYRDSMKVAARDADTGYHRKMKTPVGMQQMSDEFADGLSHFHQQVRDYYKELKRKNRYDLSLRPRCSQHIGDAIVDNPYEFDHARDEGARKKQFNNDLLDDYMVEITVKYPIPLDVSGKLTDCAGGKGIAGERVANADMPVDDYGNAVDLMMSDNAVLRRTNFNRPFECYINAARRDVQIHTLELYHSEGSEAAWDYMIGFCETVSPPWAAILNRTHATADKRKELIREFDNGAKLRVWIPTDLEKDADIIEKEVEERYPPRRSQLTITLPDGTKTRTINEFIVGELYMIRLDKTGREMSAISSGRYQHFGTISKQHAGDKYRRPMREHPIKYMGESEARHMAAYVGGDICADIHDKSNNPAVGDEVITNVMTAEVPTNIDEVIDRKKFPLGNNRAMALVNHVLSCEGTCFTTRHHERVTDLEYDI